MVDHTDPVSNTSQFGLGNLNTTLFLSPTKTNGFTWDVGPIFGFPTKSNDLLGSNTFTVGPPAVLVAMTKVSVHIPLCKRGIEGDLYNKISPNPSFSKRGTERLLTKYWVIGALANQQWSMGNAAPNQRVNALLIQPFILKRAFHHEEHEVKSESYY